MKDWITSVASASLLSCLALALCPDGRVRSVTRFVCGLVCALALASPLVTLDIGTIAAGVAEYRQRGESIAQNAEEEQKMLERGYIEERCAAYIWGKATETGTALTDVSVLARWDERGQVWYPWQVTLGAAYSGELARVIEADLGVPAQRQQWRG